MAGKNGVNIKIEANTKQAAQGIDKVTEQLNKMAKESSQGFSKFAKLGSAVSGLSAAFSIVGGAAKTAASAMNKTVEAYKTQANAEIQLETAVRNNPYLRDESAKKLKDYASQLQSIGTVGDETLIPLMAQLVSAGRSEAETMEIMSAALDASASGAISLDSAVKALCKSYAGEAGELSALNPKVKELTKEQLKSGEAVRLISDSYKGMAKSTADATGGMQKLKNSWGDFLEVLGKPVNAILNPLAAVFSSFFDKVTSGFKKVQDELDKTRKELSNGKNMPTPDEINFRVNAEDITAAEEKVKKLKESLDSIDTAKSTKSLDELTAALNNTGESSRENARKILEGTEAFRRMEDGLAALEKDRGRLEKLKKSLEDGASMKNILKTARKNSKEVYDFLTLKGVRKNTTADDVGRILEQVEKDIAIKSKAIEDEISKSIAGGVKGTAISIVDSGEYSDLETQYMKATANLDALRKKKAEQDQADREKEAAEREAARNDELEKTQDFISKQLAIVSNGENLQNQMVKEGLQDSFDWKSYASSVLSAYRNIYAEMGALAYSGSKEEAQKALALLKSFYEKAQEELAGSRSLDDLKKEINSVVSDTGSAVKAQIELLKKLREAWADIPEAVKLIDNAIKALEETTASSTAKFQEWYDAHGENFENAEKIVSKMNDAMDEYTSGQIQRYENEKDAALASLEVQHDKGLISEEEYNDKKEKIEKEAAENEYKLKMAQWASNIATTTGQVAMGVVNALAQGGPPFVAIPMAAAVGALGAAQLATLIGSKPVPPSFASGGVVGGFQGATMGGDDTYGHIRRGEMYLNAKQQRNLFDMANSRASGGLKVNIRNYMGESAEATPELSGDTLNLIIDRRVTEQLSSGAYGEALTRSDIKRQGTVITN